MAKLELNIPDQFIKLGKALLKDDSVRKDFEERPADTLRKFGVALPKEITNEKLKEISLIESMARGGAQMRNAAAVEVVAEATMTPYTYPVTAVGIAVGAAVATELGYKE